MQAYLLLLNSGRSIVVVYLLWEHVVRVRFSAPRHEVWTGANFLAPCRDRKGFPYLRECVAFEKMDKPEQTL